MANRFVIALTVASAASTGCMSAAQWSARYGAQHDTDERFIANCNLLPATFEQAHEMLVVQCATYDSNSPSGYLQCTLDSRRLDFAEKQAQQACEFVRERQATAAHEGREQTQAATAVGRAVGESLKDYENRLQSRSGAPENCTSIHTGNIVQTFCH